MIFGLLIITASFIWLLYETRLFTIRLPVGSSAPFIRQPTTLQDVLSIVFAAMIILSMMKGFENLSEVHKNEQE